MENKLPLQNTKREILVKHEATTDETYGCAPDKRPVDVLINYGIVNLNKPAGPSSHMVSEYAQKILGIDKAGHSGTLDPGVTGVLPIALGRATRVVNVLLPAGKEYVCLMRLHKPIPEEQLRTTINKFIGTITQLPPVRSAVARKERQRNVYYLDILEIQGQNILFRIGCQAGTYIRKICHDIGKKLGTGAHMAELIRTIAGPFKLENTTTLHDLENAHWYWKNENNEKYIRHCIQPLETALDHLPKIWLHDSAINTVCHGANLNIPGVAKLETGITPETCIAILTLKGELVALANSLKSSEEIMREEKGTITTALKVFMLPETYPKLQNHPQHT